MMVKIKKTILTFSILGVCLSLFGCVSTIEPQGSQIDKKQALEAHIRLGMTYLQKRDRDRALRAFTEAQKLDSRSAEAMHGFALLHQLNGEVEQAESTFKKAIKYRPVFSIAPIELSYARFLYDQDRCADALPLLNKSRTDITYPSRSGALYMLGLCAQKMNDLTLARGAFEHSLNLNTSNAAAAIELADIAFEKRDYPNAKKYLDVYSENARQSARSLWLGIRLERIFGNKDKEASYVLALKNLHPYSKELLEYKKLPK